MKNVKYVFLVILLVSVSRVFSQIPVLDSAFTVSEQFEAKKDYKSAITAVTNVYDQSSYEINLRLGWLYYLSGQYATSESYYKKAIDLMPNTIEPRLGYTTAAGSLTNNADDLIAQYSKILQVDPQNSYANYWIGMVYYNKKDYQTAEPYFEKVVNLYPFDYSSLLMDGWTKYRLGKTTEAKILFRKVLCASENDKSASEGLSLISDANNSTLVTEKEIASCFNQSEKLESNKDYKTAISVMNKVYDKSSYEINLRLAWLYYEAGENTESENYYKVAIDIMPYSVQPRLGYATAAAALGNADQLITQYSKVLEIDPQNTEANYWLGMVYYNKKDYQNADKYFQKIITLYPFGYDGLDMAAWTRFRLGKSTDAKHLFEKVLLITPLDNEIQEVLGKLSASR